MDIKARFYCESVTLIGAPHYQSFAGETLVEKVVLIAVYSSGQRIPRRRHGSSMTRMGRHRIFICRTPTKSDP